ncbi:MAG: hypothetical protein KG028_00165 [Actinobacteria bacterium]|jgi:hypothetical protein|nr:hypothetical protein [Actinomycetota bacterium]
MAVNRRDAGPGAHVVPALFVLAAVVALVTADATWAQVVLPVGVAVAVGLVVALIASRTRRFRGALVLVGWAVAGFVAAALPAEATVEPLAALLIYPPVVLWAAMFVDIAPETFRGDERYRRSDGDALS